MSALPPRIARQFEDYELFHQHPMNKRLHYIGVPLIMLGLLGMLSAWKFGEPVDGGLLLWFTAASYYSLAARRLGVMFSGFAFLVYLLSRELPLAVLLSAFVVGWAVQGVGHAHFERKSPAFLKNLEHLLIGPLWLFQRMFP